MANPDGGTGFPGQIQGRDPDSNEPVDVFVDEVSGAIMVGLRVWNTTTLVWDRMTQPEVEEGTQDTRMDYTSGNIDYRGTATTHKAATDAGDLWKIEKYTWVSSNLVRIEGPLTGNWDDRATLAWG